MMPNYSRNIKKSGEFFLPSYIYLMDDKFLRQLDVSSIIQEIRGGSLSMTLLGNVFFIALLYGIWMLGSGSEGFVPQHQHPGWG